MMNLQGQEASLKVLQTFCEKCQSGRSLLRHVTVFGEPITAAEDR